MNNLFTYGLLKRDGPLAGVMEVLGEFRAEVRSAHPHYSLFSVYESYPAAFPGDHYLIGELWELTHPIALEYLDSIENMYRRKRIEFCIPDGDINPFGDLPDGRGEAWIYLWNHWIKDWHDHIIFGEDQTVRWENDRQTTAP